MSLKQKSGVALAWDLGGTIVKSLGGFVISIFLARLLTPEEFGLVGMAMVFITVSQVFIDVGFASSLIQSKKTTNLSYSSVFWLNLVMGFVLTAIFYLSASYIGNFYDNQEITNIVQWLSLIFLLNSFCIVQTALLKKKLNFKVLSLSNMLAGIIGGIVGVVFAFMDYGVYSLVIQNIITAILLTIFLWSAADWKPDFKFSFNEIKKLTGYSTYVFVDRFVSSLFERLDIIVIGKVLSPATLGFYTRAVSLKSLVTKYSSSSISKVFFPVLSSIQDDDEQFERVYFKIVSIVSFISFGLTGVLYVLGEDIIILLFGNKWMPSVTIFQILIISACNYPLSSMMVNAFMSKGKSKENFYIGLFRKAIRIVPLYLAYKYGIVSFAVGVVVVSYFLTITNMMFLKKFTNLSLRMHFKKIFEGIIPLIIIILVYQMLNPEQMIYRIGLALLFIITYIGYNHLLKTEGYTFVKSNYPLVINKIQKKLRV
ncbi:lipopolysaccharide biosynthesis protein [Psychroserpens sp. S379A]|uniref:lipopolysaccharide biosynthesis protein n=1 Tax=Psychroserpens sp. S379A TaxID=3415137 RepID=UPI003C7CFB5A